MYISTLSLTSVLNLGGLSKPRPSHFTAGKDPVPILKEAGWAPRPVWTGVENLAPTGIRSPDHPARSESYRLSYRGPKSRWYPPYIASVCRLYRIENL
jgi:hypothetical protein